MEELHAAANAYYSHCNEDIRRVAYDFFRSMDTDSDGKISHAEFKDFVQQSGYNWILHYDPNLFAKLDRNRDGGLDFQEVLTFYYIIKTRYITCQSCRAHLCGLYFTCVECFDGAADTHDLCAACYDNAVIYGNATLYGNGNIHSHSHFLDNHVLLHKRRRTHAPPNLAMAVAQQSPPVNITNNNYYVNQAAPQIGWNKWFRVFEAFEALEVALSIPALLSNCTIM